MNPAQNQGRLLILDGTPQNFAVINNPVIDPGMQQTSSGLYATFTEQLQAPFGNFDNTNNTNLQTANAIFNTLLPGVSGFGFATFGTGGASDFTPSNFVNGVPPDFNSSFGFSVFPIIGEQPIPGNIIPEPTTMLLWGVVVLGAGLFGRSRLRKA
jgi:hypothetical protein